MFRALISTIFRSARLCLQLVAECTHDVADHRPVAGNIVHYTTS